MEKEAGILGKFTSEGPARVPGFQGCYRDSGRGIPPGERPPPDQLHLVPNTTPTPKDDAQGRNALALAASALESLHSSEASIFSSFLTRFLSDDSFLQ